MSSSKRLRIAISLIVPSFVFIFSLVIAEAVFRMLGDLPTEDKKGFFFQFNERNFKLAPDINTTSSWSSGKFSVHSDSLGLRCDNNRRFATKEGDKIDFLFLGDSQGFGNGVNFEDTIPGRVAILAYDNNIHVANGSVGGHTLRNQLEIYEWLHIYKGIKIDHCILLMTPAMLTECDQYLEAIVGDDGRLYGHNPDIKKRILIWIKSHSVTYGRIRDALRFVGVVAEPSSDFIFDIFNSATSSPTSHDKFSDCISRSYEFFKKNNTELWLVYVPLTIEIDFDVVQRLAVSQSMALDSELPSRIIKATAENLQIPFINFRPVLENINATGQSLHLKGDFHYNKELSRACGEYLWQEMRARLSLIEIDTK